MLLKRFNNTLSSIHKKNDLIFQGTNEGNLKLNIYNNFNSNYYQIIKQPFFDTLTSYELNSAITAIESYDRGNGKLMVICGGERILSVFDYENKYENNFDNFNGSKNENNLNGINAFHKLNLEKENNLENNVNNLESKLENNLESNFNNLESSLENNINFNNCDNFENNFNLENHLKNNFNLNNNFNCNDLKNHINIKNSFFIPECEYTTLSETEIHSLHLSDHYLFITDYRSIRISNLYKLNLKKCTSLSEMNNSESKILTKNETITSSVIENDKIFYGTSEGKIKKIIDSKNYTLLEINCKFNIFNTIYDMKIKENILIIRIVNKIIFYDLRGNKILNEIVIFEGNEENLRKMEKNEEFYLKMKIDTFINNDTNINDSNLIVCTGDLENNILFVTVNGIFKKMRASMNISYLVECEKYIWGGNNEIGVYKI